MSTTAYLKSLFGGTILKRGEQYYESCAVEKLNMIGEDRWAAEVYGSDTYKVFVHWADDRLLEAECDCPYGDHYGDYCKHIAAVCLAIIKEGNAIKQEAAAELEDVKKAIHRIPPQKLKSLLKELCSSDTVLRNALVQHLAPERKQAGHSAGPSQHAHLQAIFRKFAYRGQIRSQSVTDFTIAVENSLNRLITGSLQPTDKVGGLCQSIAFLTSTAPKIEDFEHELDELANTCMEMVEEQLYEMEEPDELRASFQLLKNQSEQGDWHSPQWEIAVLKLALIAVEKKPDLGPGLLKVIDKKRRESNSSHWYFDNRQIPLRRLEAQTREAFEKDFKYEDFLFDNRKEHWAFQELLNLYQEEEDWPAALNLIEDALGWEDLTLFTIRRLEEIRFDLWLALKDWEALADWAAHEAVDSGRMDYYFMLKESTNMAEWLQLFDKMAVAARRHAREHDAVATPLLCHWYAEEGMHDRLIDALIHDPDLELLDQYKGLLIETHRSPTLELMAEFIRAEAEGFSSRKQYRKLCEHLTWIAAHGGKMLAMELKRSFIEAYPRRKVMLQELERLEFD